MLFDAIYKVFAGPFPDTTKQDEKTTMRFIELKKDDKYAIVELKYKNTNPWVVVCQPGGSEIYLDRIYENGWDFYRFLYYDDWNDVYKNMVQHNRNFYTTIKTGMKHEGN
jgi:hypothetical protein